MKPIALLIGLLLILLACDKGNKTKVEYKVVCASGCDITYDMNGDTFTELGSSGSWGIVYKDKSDESVYLSATKNSEFGTVMVTIYLDGKKFKSASTSASFDTATVEGSIP